MATRFEALTPTFSITGVANSYRVQFIDTVTDQPVVADSVESVEVIDPNDVILATITPPDILNPQPGLYEVVDVPRNVAGAYTIRWTYILQGVTLESSYKFEYVSSTLNEKREQIKSYVLDKLGRGVVTVEIQRTLGTLDTVLRQSELWFIMHKSQRSEFKFTIQPNQEDYSTVAKGGPLPDDIYYVAELWLPEAITRVEDALGAFGIYGFAQLGISNLPVEDIASAGSAQGVFSSLVQVFQYNEIANEVLSNNLSWEWKEQEKTLRILPPPGRGGTGYISYYRNSVDYDCLQPEDEFFIREYALAEAKEVVGRMRSKFSGYPTAEGERNLDGDQLLAESSEMKQQLNEMIERRAFGTGFYVG